MTLVYKVATKLDHEVIITVERVVEIISPDDYTQHIKPLEGFSIEAMMSVYDPNAMKPDNVSSYHSKFFTWFTPVRLSNGEVTLISTEHRPINVGDTVRYDVITDEFVFFDASEFKNRLTLIEKPDGQ